MKTEIFVVDMQTKRNVQISFKRKSSVLFVKKKQKDFAQTLK